MRTTRSYLRLLLVVIILMILVSIFATQIGALFWEAVMGFLWYLLTGSAPGRPA